ncbi:MAG: hypothetical protein ACKO0Z_16995 [Betaproteobacteria bacterium]
MKREPSSRRFLDMLKKIDAGNVKNITRKDAATFVAACDAGLVTGIWTTSGLSNATLTPDGAKYIHDNEHLLFSNSTKGKTWNVLIFLLAAVVGGFIVGITQKIVDVVYESSIRQSQSK